MHNEKITKNRFNRWYIIMHFILLLIIKGDNMDIINKIVHILLFMEKEPQQVGLSQLKHKSAYTEQEGASIRKKDVKLSDLMRRAG